MHNVKIDAKWSYRLISHFIGTPYLSEISSNLWGALLSTLLNKRACRKVPSLRFYPRERISTKTNNLSCFTPKFFSTGIAHYNHYYNLNHREQCQITLVAIKMLIREFGTVQREMIEVKFGNKRLDFLEFCKMTNKIMYRGNHQCLLS